MQCMHNMVKGTQLRLTDIARVLKVTPSTMSTAFLLGI